MKIPTERVCQVTCAGGIVVANTVYSVAGVETKNKTGMDNQGNPVKKEGRMEGYCMKCRAKKEIKNPTSVTLKNGRPATRGVCPTCGTKIVRITKA